MRNKFTVFFLVTCYLLLITIPAFAQNQNATDSSKSVRDTLRERVEKRLEALTNKPKAVIGTITDIQDSSLVVQTKNGTRQVKITSDTVLVSNNKNSKKPLTTKDLAIGNAVVAMGFMNTNDILDAQRILVLDSLPALKKKVLHGVIDSLAKNKLTVRQGDQAWIVSLAKDTRITHKSDNKISDIVIDDLQEGENVIVVGLPAKDSNNLLTATRIHIVTGVAAGFNNSAAPSPKLSPSPKASPSPKPKSAQPTNKPDVSNP